MGLNGIIRFVLVIAAALWLQALGSPMHASAQVNIACCTATGCVDGLSAAECVDDEGGTAIGGSGSGTLACATAQACCLSDTSDPDGASLCDDTLTACECLAKGGISTPGTCAAGCCGQVSGPPANQNVSPFGNEPILCAAFHGFPFFPALVPPPNPIAPGWPRDDEAYVNQPGGGFSGLVQFLRERQYVNLGWIPDPNWRLAGGIDGLPPEPHLNGDPLRGVWKGPHPAIRIYYSPEVMEWLCDGRPNHCSNFGFTCNTNADCGGAPCRNLPEEGAMIVKEMHPITSFGVDGSDLWLDQQCYSGQPTAWTVMTLGGDESHDGWFWTFIDASGAGNPPVIDASGIASATAMTAAEFATHCETHFPTGQAVGFPMGRRCVAASATACSTNADCGGGACVAKGRCLETCDTCLTDADCGGTTCVKAKAGTEVAKLYGYGTMGCPSCHASAVSGSTFASLENILGNSLTYQHTATPSPPRCSGDGVHTAGSPFLGGECQGGDDDGRRCLTDVDCAGGGVCAPEAKCDGADCVISPYAYSSPMLAADPDFLALFSQFGGTGVDYATAFTDRLPAETYDRIVATPTQAVGPTPNEEQFLTSDQCASCHDAAVLTNGVLPNMLRCEESPDGPRGDRAINLSPYAEWKASPMGMAGRDPVFFSQLEGERNLWPNRGDCIDTLCMSCHGVMGQRQLQIDSPGATQCEELVGTGRTQPFDMTDLFTRDHIDAWPDSSGGLAMLTDAKYGGLGRDGVSCVTCHGMDDLDLGDPSTFTGQFFMGPADQVAGPYNTNVKPAVMQSQLGITPGHGAHITSSDLCGSCHAIELPVLDTTPAGSGGPLIGLKCTVGDDTSAVAACEPAGTEGQICNVTGTCEKYFKFEQTTFLEWQNSDYKDGGSLAMSCQDCHMKTHYEGDPLSFKIANIQDDTAEAAMNALPAGDVTLDTRSDYGRHTLYGLNVFLNEMAQQFSELLGLRQINPSNVNAVPALLTAREAVLDQAANDTVDLAVGTPTLESIPASTDKLLTAEVTVTNKAGHKFPSGVGFRRAFLEFRVLDGGGATLWASGRTDDLGVVVEGTGTTRLASELFEPAPTPDPGCPASAGGIGGVGPGAQCYQPHFETITSEDEVQIYEELVQNNGGEASPGDRRFSSSFLQRWFDVKDNRILPSGWVSTMAGNSEHTGPAGDATSDALDYPLDGSPAPGLDRVTYEATLSAAEAAQAASVEVALYYQSMPPRYLNDRFSTTGVTRDTERLHHITSRLDVGVTDGNGEPFIEDWKLEVGTAVNEPIVVITTTTTTTTIVTTTTTTTTTLPPSGVCPAAPLGGCRSLASGKSNVTVKVGRRFRWRWKDGDPTAFADYGDPINGSGTYSLCVYDSSAQPQPLMNMEVPTGSAWLLRTFGSRQAYKYRSSTGEPDGIRRLILKPSSNRGAEIRAVGGPAYLPVPTLPASFPMTVQLVVNDGGVECWEAEFATARRNTAAKVKAKAP